MADLKSGSTVGGSVILTQGTFPLIPSGNSLSYNGFLLYSENDKPTKADVGLDQVNNWGATSATNNASDVLYATAGAVKRAYDLANSKLDADGLVQVSGYDPKLVMSQKAVTDNLDLKLDKAGGSITGPLTVGSSEYSGIDLKQNTGRYVRIENTPHGAANFLRIFKREADGTNIASFDIPAGFGTAATQQWVNAMIMTGNPSAPETVVRNPNGTNRLCLVVKDNGTAGAYDFANSRWAFLHNQAGFKVFGSGEFQSSGDYASVILKKSDNRFVQIETTPHAGSTTMLNFIYRQADGTNQHVMQLPYETGTIASREWTNLRFRRDSDGVVITPLDSNEAGWWQHIKTNYISFQNGNQSRLILNDSLMNVGMGISVKSNYANSDMSKVEVTAPDGQKSIGLWAYNDGRTLLSAYAGGAWSNITIGGVGNGVIALREWVNTNYHSNLAINNISSSWISMRDQPCFRSGNVVANDSASCILRQEHAERHFMVGGLGNTQFGIYMLNKNQTTNGLNGAAYLEYTGTWRCHGNGSFNDVEIRSDIRKKSELAIIDSSLAKLKTLTGYTYLVEDENKTKHISAGLIAQDVQKVLPEVVNEDSSGFLTMTYNGIHALVIEAIKELSDRVEQLEVKYGN